MMCTKFHLNLSMGAEVTRRDRRQTDRQTHRHTNVYFDRILNFYYIKVRPLFLSGLYREYPPLQIQPLWFHGRISSSGQLLSNFGSDHIISAIVSQSPLATLGRVDVKGCKVSKIGLV